MPRLTIVFFIFSLSLIFSCAPYKVCSGLNPVTGSYNSSKKMRKGRKSLHSDPERSAYTHRQKEMKKKNAVNGRNHSTMGGAIKAGGGFSFHIGGGGAHASGHVNAQAKH